MKHILITGVNSYIGSALQKHLQGKPYQITVLDVRNDDWTSRSFAGVDAVLHVAAMVHQKERPDMEEEFFRVNRDLAVRVARKAKADGVGQFLFMSSMSVYGTDTGVITPETVPQPTTFYGKSKLEAEALLRQEADEGFRVCILRPPMVYGPGCKGNFQNIIKIVKRLPLFPVLDNTRSMIYIENLCEFLKLCIDRCEEGLFFPQNREYVQTAWMARVIAGKLGRSIWFSPLVGRCIYPLIHVVPIFRKAFGSQFYQGTERHDFCYCIRDNAESVEDSVPTDR